MGFGGNHLNNSWDRIITFPFIFSYLMRYENDDFSLKLSLWSTSLNFDLEEYWLYRVYSYLSGQVYKLLLEISCWCSIYSTSIISRWGGRVQWGKILTFILIIYFIHTSINHKYFICKQPLTLYAILLFLFLKNLDIVYLKLKI